MKIFIEAFFVNATTKIISLPCPYLPNGLTQRLVRNLRFFEVFANPAVLKAREVGLIDMAKSSTR